jgi:hypothetical protein
MLNFLVLKTNFTPVVANSGCLTIHIVPIIFNALLKVFYPYSRSRLYTILEPNARPGCEKKWKISNFVRLHLICAKNKFDIIVFPGGLFGIKKYTLTRAINERTANKNPINRCIALKCDGCLNNGESAAGIGFSKQKKVNNRPPDETAAAGMPFYWSWGGS